MYKKKKNNKQIQTRLENPFFQNYDLYYKLEENEISPGVNVYNEMNKGNIQSIDEFIKKKRKARKIALMYICKIIKGECVV